MRVNQHQEWLVNFYQKRNWYQLSPFVRLNFLTEEVGGVVTSNSGHQNWSGPSWRTAAQRGAAARQPYGRTCRRFGPTINY